MSATRQVTSTDGVRLAVQEHGDPRHPTIVAVHGYPDDHTVWDGVVALLAERFHVVTYDVRGAGGSDKPRGRAAYRIAQLVEDFAAVLDTVSPDRPVHVLAHDWGSIQIWDAVTDPRFADRLLSFTSISGPSLDMAAAWLRGAFLHGARRHQRAALRQLAASSYVAFFQLPWLPERVARVGLVQRAAARSATHGLSTPMPRRGTDADAVHGIGLYRANFLSRLTRPKPRRTTVPVLVLAPKDDLHVDSGMQRTAPAPYVDDLRTLEIEGNHWVVAHAPEVIASHVEDFVAGC